MRALRRRAAACLAALTLLAGVLPAYAGEDAAVFAHPLDAAGLAALLGPAQRLAAASGLRGRFEQRKYLQELPQPLLSSGEFLFARGLGIWWHTRVPFDSVFVLTRSGIRNTDEGGARMELRSDDQPAVAGVARIFFALFALDFRTLSSEFDLYGMPAADAGPGAWMVGLRPRSSALAGVFGQALIAGAARATRVELSDAQGDRTVVAIPEASAIEGPLTPQDRQRFAD
ncbi:MAG: outer membrane lipoprotein carrier protein LolA [Nevskia sp.]|nr:outer membrane lipoprotein carrier protein LolA [Nevskia sp.]